MKESKENQSLWDITEELRYLDELLEQGYELTTDDEKVFIHARDALVNKTDSVCSYIEYQKDLIELAKAKIEKYKDYVKSRDSKIKSFEKYIINCMSKIQMTEVSGKLNTIKLRKPTKVVKILDEYKLPEEFLKLKTSVEVDKKKLKEHLKDNELEGATLVDSENMSLNIKFRG